MLHDGYPVTDGHRLVVPFRHVANIFELVDAEVRDMWRLVCMTRREVVASDPSVMGFNVGVNCGAVAGQTVAHAHAHVIPRRVGDTTRPAGGVRGVVPERMSYRLSCELCGVGEDDDCLDGCPSRAL